MDSPSTEDEIEIKITRENEHLFVATKDCRTNECPNESGCLDSYKTSLGDNICMCYHSKPIAPLKKGSKCPRDTVPLATNTEGWPDLNHPSIPVQIGKRFSSESSTSTSRPEATVPVVSITIIALSASIAVVLLIIGFCLNKKCSRKQLRKKSSPKMEMVDISSGNSLLFHSDRFVNNPTYDTTCIDLAVHVYSPEQVHLSAQIGQGCFGKVFKGVLNGVDVAIKLIKKEYSDEAIKEVETMSSFSHPNILHLIGIVRGPDCESPWLIFEFMKYGDLVSVLRKNGPKYPIQEIKPEQNNVLQNDLEQNGDDLLVTSETLMDFSSQIAEGMKYLSSQHFVHRDLAARNCLVSARGIIKISDFGLSRDVYTCDYYKIGGSRLLPLRWMAPESILYGRFTLESDVWAYGVLLWEIWNYGKQPYYGHSNEEVVQLILDGVLLCPPSDCPPTIFSVMEGCWKTEGRDRLKFHQIVQKLTPKAQKTPETAAMESWIESGYEIPKHILEKGYFQVV